jgi:hypothetical protein
MLNVRTAVGYMMYVPQACPARVFGHYWRLRQEGLPLGSSASLDAACAPSLLQQLGPQAAAAYEAAGLRHHPELLAAAGSGALDDALAGSTRLHAVRSSQTASSAARQVPAWLLPADLAAPPVATQVTQVLAAAGAALAWLRGHADAFPLLQQHVRAAAGG